MHTPTVHNLSRHSEVFNLRHFDLSVDKISAKVNAGIVLPPRVITWKESYFMLSTAMVVPCDLNNHSKSLVINLQVQLPSDTLLYK
jgi:hypothetical protein